jgi:hypothetical protein
MNPLDFGEPILGCIADFEGAAGHEARVVNSEHYCSEHRAILRIEGAVDEDVVLVAASGYPRFGYPCLRVALATAWRMRARPIEVFLPDVLRTRPFVEDFVARATDFLAGIALGV